MKIAVSLVLDGMVKALRVRTHTLAERREHGYAPSAATTRVSPAPKPGRATAGRDAAKGRKGRADDLAGR